MRIRPTALLLLAATLGCSHGETEAAPTAAPSVGGETSVELRLLRLLDPGAEPRRALRYQVAYGRTERFTMDIGMGAAADLEGVGGAAASVPLVRLVVEVGPVEAFPDGAIRAPIAIVDVVAVVDEGTDPDDIAALDADLSPLLALRGTVEVNSEGHTRVADFQVPETTNERLLTALGNIRTSILTVPLPTEPVGVGARWEVTRDVDLGALTVRQTVTYTLRSLAGPEGELQVSFRQSGAAQPMAHLGEGVTGRLDAYESTGLGSIDFDLTRMTPYSEAEITTQMQATVTHADGGTATISVRIRSAVAVAPAP